MIQDQQNSSQENQANEQINEEILTEETEENVASEETCNNDTSDTTEQNSEETSNSQETQEASNEAEPEVVEEKTVRETDWKDSYIRLAADFDNYRKRTSSEQDDIRRRERERVLESWLDVYDNAERALASMTETSGVWYDGFSAIVNQMNRVLSKYSIKPMDTEHQKFDPKYHEAIATLPNPAMENGAIMHVEKRGFVYENGNVMRVARVVVVKNS